MQVPLYTTKGMTTSRQWRRPPWRMNQPAPQPDSTRFQPSAGIPPPRPPNPMITIPGATEKGISNQAPFLTLGTGTDDSTLMRVLRTSHHTSIETTMARTRPCLTPPWPPSANASQTYAALMTTPCATCLLSYSSS